MSTYIETLGLLIGASLTLMCYSFLWKENRLWRFAEHLFIGIASGHLAVMNKSFLMGRVWTPIVERGDTTVLIPVIIGLMYCFYFSKRLKWLVRYPTVLLVGMGTGLAMSGVMKAQFTDQIKATSLSLAVKSPLDVFNNLIIIIGVIGSLSVFIFTRQRTGTIGVMGRIGRYILMVAFGAAYGFNIMSWFSFVIGRLDAIFVPPALYVIPVGVIILIAVILREKTR